MCVNHQEALSGFLKGLTGVRDLYEVKAANI
jgi:hypothetical protein